MDKHFHLCKRSNRIQSDFTDYQFQISGLILRSDFHSKAEKLTIWSLLQLRTVIQTFPEIAIKCINFGVKEFGVLKRVPWFSRGDQVSHDIMVAMAITHLIQNNR